MYPQTSSCIERQMLFYASRRLDKRIDTAKNNWIINESI